MHLSKGVTYMSGHCHLDSCTIIKEYLQNCLELDCLGQLIKTDTYINLDLTKRGPVFSGGQSKNWVHIC